MVGLQDLEARPWEIVDDRLRRKVVHAERMTVTVYEFDAGGKFPDHTHEQEQVTYVRDGTVTFTLDGVAHRVDAGNLIVIPPNAVHDARASAPATVVSVVSPSRRAGESIRYERVDGAER